MVLRCKFITLNAYIRLKEKKGARQLNKKTKNPKKLKQKEKVKQNKEGRGNKNKKIELGEIENNSNNDVHSVKASSSELIISWKYLSKNR